MQLQALFTKLKKTKDHGTISPNQCVIGRLESASFGARHSSRVSAWLLGSVREGDDA